VTAINLAYSFAHDKTKKVLLVDADLRRSKIASYLGITEELSGFTEVLEGIVTFDEARVNTEYENLHILLGHTYGSAENASELLDSKAMSQYLDRWKATYDYIILDSPPILPVTDAAVLGKKVDGVLLVFKAAKTQKNTIKHAQHLFEQAGVYLLGYVMTHVEALAPGRRDYYSSYYRY
jgi:polysaccharide biosynthesis transport protein